jgi:biopolymer transport protein ExbD
MKARHKMKKPERLNLIPIMDAVFIFIFFLLMSAQFITVYEIGSSVPMVREVTTPPDKKEPLQFVMEISDRLVIVRTGKEGREIASFNDDEWGKLRVQVRELKKNNPEEKIVTLRPHKKVPFKRLVKAIDHAKGDPQTKEKFFEEVVFDGREAL